MLTSNSIILITYFQVNVNHNAFAHSTTKKQVSPFLVRYFSL